MSPGTLCRRLAFLAVMGLTCASCAAGQHARMESRVEKLEQELAGVQARMDVFSLQSESIAVGLEKQRARLEQVFPPTAQWLELAPGATIRWYLGDEAGNLHVQCIAPPSGDAAGRVEIMTDENSLDWSPREGQSLEFTWEAGEKQEAVVITYHRSLERAGGELYGLFSIAPVGALDLP